ncbi:MAG: DUF2878 domain-containing protein [Methylotenera sp.]|nr:DUF2878 domain-containing protein [Methylotenera sp.]MDP2102141.1 DUF2878 domain-containing protein [Methylotenera sp.]MDP2281101.1 DUF2878 domain-containing protein [Methylotenera sp.]MDP3061196.1 DUF2878 domain-containing protein [Methylotenera sp.]
MLLTNFILFQIAWLSCVAGAAKGLPWLGVAVTIVVLGWHLFKAKQAMTELMLIVAALLIGASFDQTMLSMEWVAYQQHGWSASLVPVWILALWGGFASTLNVSLAWMQQRYITSVLFGAAGGPLAYLGAEKIGAVALYGNTSYIALAVGWAVITPVLLHLAKRLNGLKTERAR